MSVRVEVEEETLARAGPGWLAWLVWATLALLLGLAFWLLLGACGVRMLHGWPLLYLCPASAPAPGVAPALGAEVERQRALEAEIERLELTLLGAPACPPQAQAEPAPAPVPEPEPTPAPEPEPEAIPEEAWDERDVSFLEGCWELESDYRVQNVRTGVVKRAESWQVCFDAAGEGRQTLTFDDGTTCTGPMQGEFGDQGRLELRDPGNLPCDDRSYVYERHISCERVDRVQARCDSFQPETGGRGDVTFRHRAEADE